jgi:hypothetical protein
MLRAYRSHGAVLRCTLASVDCEICESLREDIAEADATANSEAAEQCRRAYEDHYQFVHGSDPETNLWDDYN